MATDWKKELTEKERDYIVEHQKDETGPVRTFLNAYQIVLNLWDPIAEGIMLEALKDIRREMKTLGL